MKIEEKWTKLASSTPYGTVISVFFANLSRAVEQKLISKVAFQHCVHRILKDPPTSAYTYNKCFNDIEALLESSAKDY